MLGTVIHRGVLKRATRKNMTPCASDSGCNTASATLWRRRPSTGLISNASCRGSGTCTGSGLIMDCRGKGGCSTVHGKHHKQIICLFICLLLQTILQVQQDMLAHELIHLTGVAHRRPGPRHISYSAALLRKCMLGFGIELGGSITMKKICTRSALEWRSESRLDFASNNAHLDAVSSRTSRGTLASCGQS